MVNLISLFNQRVIDDNNINENVISVQATKNTKIMDYRNTYIMSLAEGESIFKQVKQGIAISLLTVVMSVSPINASTHTIPNMIESAQSNTRLEVLKNGNNSYNANDSVREMIDMNNRYASKSLVRIEEISKLEDNWNGDGASKFSICLMDKCRDIVQQLPFQPKIYPTGSNSIQMEYEMKNGKYLEFQIFDNHIEVFTMDEFDNEQEWDIDQPNYMEDMKKLVNEFYEC